MRRRGGGMGAMTGGGDERGEGGATAS